MPVWPNGTSEDLMNTRRCNLAGYTIAAPSGTAHVPLGALSYTTNRLKQSNTPCQCTHQILFLNLFKVPLN